ncbi:MAG: leucyl aminopeptidase family protein, partial [Thermovirgaceae bacterium]
MKIRLLEGDVSGFKGDAVAILLYEEELEKVHVVGKDLAPIVKDRMDKSAFTAKKDTLLAVPVYEGRVSAVYLAGLGSKGKAEPDAMRRGSAGAIRQAMQDRFRSLAVSGVSEFDSNETVRAVEGVVIGAYRFLKYKTDSQKQELPPEMEEVFIAGSGDTALKKGRIAGEAQNIARDLANEPGNVINPAVLAEKAAELAAECGLECTVFEEDELREMGMNGLLAVGGASETPPRLIHLVYRPEKTAKRRIAFVGKGITFDSGGLNIKPGEHMRTMKGDKTGACNVMAVMKAVSRLKPPVEVHGLIGAAENMPGGGAYRPDDVIVMKNGKTVEIDNTDAEGRVTLADVLAYACEQKPAAVVDMATLTGACVVALGEYTAGLFSPDDSMAQKFLETSAETGERMWRLPLDDERLRKKIKSDIADVVNTGGRTGGAITAAMFLEEFVE